MSDSATSNLFDEQRGRGSQVQPIESSIDAKRLTQFSGARTEVAQTNGPRPVDAHLLNPLLGLERSDQHGNPLIRLPADNIEAMVHAVGEVDVGVAALKVHRLVPGCASPSKRVGGTVRRTEIRLHFDDDSGSALAVAQANQPLAEQSASHRNRWQAKIEESAINRFRLR